MPVDWAAYDRFDWAASRQLPLAVAGRDVIARLAADVLGLSPNALDADASPPGRYAATVLRVHPGVPHPFGDGPVGLKVYKSTPEATREGNRLVDFHVHRLHRLPGLPNPRVQRTLSAGVERSRPWLAIEWRDGETLADVLRRPVTRPVASELLRQMFAEIVVPLWAAGLVWWDVRDANWVVDEAGQLSLIDTDSLAACADEILTVPSGWTAREKARTTALARLRRTAERVSRAAGERRPVFAPLEAALRRLGRHPEAVAEAAEGVRGLVSSVRSSVLSEEVHPPAS